MLSAFALLAVFCGAILFRAYRGKSQNIALLPYQRGILYVRGLPARDVGPGTHQVRLGTEFVVHIDTRPIAIRADGQAVALQDGATAVYGISASAEVQDIRKAIYSARNYNHLPPYLLRRSVRRVLSASSSDTLIGGTAAIEKAVAADAEPQFVAAGFALASFRLHQLSVGPRPEHPASNAEAVTEKRLVN